MDATDTPDAAERARARAKALADLYWHVGTFVIINAFLWLIDLTLGDDGITWAPWVTAAWGLGLAFHVLAYLVQGRQLVARKTEQYLRDDPGR